MPSQNKTNQPTNQTQIFDIEMWYSWGCFLLSSGNWWCPLSFPDACFVVVTLLSLREFLATITSKTLSSPFSLSAATDILITGVFHYSLPSQPSNSSPNCDVSSWFSLDLAPYWLWLVSFFFFRWDKKDREGQSPFPSNRRLDISLVS